MSGFCVKDNTALNADGTCPKCGAYYPELDGFRDRTLKTNESKVKL